MEHLYGIRLSLQGVIKLQIWHLIANYEWLEQICFHCWAVAPKVILLVMFKTHLLSRSRCSIIWEGKWIQELNKLVPFHSLLAGTSYYIINAIKIAYIRFKVWISQTVSNLKKQSSNQQMISTMYLRLTCLQDTINFSFMIHL